MKFTLYGSHSCPRTIRAINLAFEMGLNSGVDFNFVDVTGGVPELKSFIAFRDAHPEEFADYIRKGLIGIPCFAYEDGTVAFELKKM